MGNTSSTGSVSEHIAHASRTGVCALQSKGLKEVCYKYVCSFLLPVNCIFVTVKETM